MARSEPPDQPSEAEQVRAAWGALVFPAYFVVAFALCYISAFHAPKPHEVDVGIDGPSALVAPVEQRLQASVGDEFNVSTMPSAAEAVERVRDRDLAGASSRARRPARRRWRRR